MKVEIKTEIEIDLKTCAKWFANLDDDSQAKFFVEVEMASREWKSYQDGQGTDFQWFLVGSHLKNCSCSTPEARQMIETIYHGMQKGDH